MKKFLPLTILTIVLFGVAACSGSSKFDGLSTSNMRIDVFLDTNQQSPTYGDCTVDANDIPLDIGDHDNWHLHFEVNRNNVSQCGRANVTLQPDRVSGDDGALIDTSDVAEPGGGDYNELDVIIAPGVFRVLIDGHPTEMTITVTANDEETGCQFGTGCPTSPDNDGVQDPTTTAG